MADKETVNKHVIKYDDIEKKQKSENIKKKYQDIYFNRSFPDIYGFLCLVEVTTRTKKHQAIFSRPSSDIDYIVPAMALVSGLIISQMNYRSNSF